MENQLQNTVRVERARHNITQKELAKAVHCSHISIHNIESGKYNVGLILALKIANYFDMQVEEIFTLN